MAKTDNQNNLIRAAFKECRLLLLGAFGISFLINMLTLAVPIFTMQVFDRVLSSGSFNTLWMLTLIVIFALVFGGVLTLLRTAVFAQVSRWLDDKIAPVLVAKTISLSLLRPNIGAQPLRDLAAVRGFVSSPTLGHILDAPWAIIFFAVLFIINTTVGIVVTISALILLVLAVIAQKAPSKMLAESGDAQVHSMQSLDAIVRNAEVVQAMGMTEAATRFWKNANEMHQDASYRASILGASISNFTRSFRMGLQVLITALGAYLVINGQMSMGSIIAVNILTGKALAPFDAAVAIYQAIVSLRKSNERLCVVFDTELRASDNLVLPDPTGAVRVDAVSYKEPLSGRMLLKGVSVDIAAGSCVGIIGPSGSGKTTLSRLLTGVMQPSSGLVQLDSASLDQWNSAQLAAAIGYLPQDVELFSGTVAENIARMQANAGDEDVVAAAKLAEVHEFILGLPDGYQTDIGDKGAALSAGQRQRVALARCFFGNPKLIVLDEPNSNLDTEGELALVRAMLNAKEKGITFVLIAHRPQLLHHADQIAVLKEGAVVLQGKARDVLEKLAGANKTVLPLRAERA